MLRELLLCRGDGQGLAGPDTDQLFIRFALGERLKRLAVRPLAQVGCDESLDVRRRFLGRYAPQQRSTDFGVLAQAATQIDLVRLEFFVARFVAPRGRTLQADVGHPVVGARVRAPVDSDLEPLDSAPKPILEAQHDLLQLRLGLGDGVVAQRLTSAADAAAANAVDI